jgi:hypothetical protein
MALPIPLLAPVTMATFWERENGSGIASLLP